MSSKNYIIGRKKYQRPQAVLFSDTPGTLDNGYYVPDGYESQSAYVSAPEVIPQEFIVLSDHGRQPIQMKAIRIEQRQRTVNGRMRSIHVADKLSMTISWNMLPSRAYPENPAFDTETGLTTATPYTVDGGAGGVEILEWYENHKGSFYVFLSYDKYNEFATNKYNHLPQYSQILEMFVSDFSYSIEKRGATNHDLWSVSLTLEEA